MSNPLDDDHLDAAQKFRENTPSEVLEGYENWQEAVDEHSGFDDKTRELIALAAGAASKCKFCIHSHGQKALRHGATEEEIAATVQLASKVAAGATMAYGLEALEHADD